MKNYIVSFLSLSLYFPAAFFFYIQTKKILFAKNTSPFSRVSGNNNLVRSGFAYFSTHLFFVEHFSSCFSSVETDA